MRKDISEMEAERADVSIHALLLQRDQAEPLLSVLATQHGEDRPPNANTHWRDTREQQECNERRGAQPIWLHRYGFNFNCVPLDFWSFWRKQASITLTAHV